LQEAKVVLAELETKNMKISLETFQPGLEVEFEHGVRFPEANDTNNYPILTGKIVLAHFKETLDYYQRLEVAEIEGDLLKAVVSKNAPKVSVLYAKLLKAKRQVKQKQKGSNNRIDYHGKNILTLRLLARKTNSFIAIQRISNLSKTRSISTIGNF